MSRAIADEDTETCRLLFIEECNALMNALQYGKVDTQRLKITQHVHDNRKGFVAHAACYTASSLPTGI
jgi:hypothetical protein